MTAKARIVAADYREQGRRRALNLGHTLAHALEPLLNLPHGEAVSLGLSAVARTAAAQGTCTPRTARRIIALLDACGLPTACPPPPTNAVARYVARDKKSTAGTVGWVVPTKIGHVAIDVPLPLTTILPHLQP